MACDSIEKLKEVLECAIRCGVHIGPIRIQLMDTINNDINHNNDQDDNHSYDSHSDNNQSNEVNDIDHDCHDHSNIKSIKANRMGVLIIPLYSWYHKSWDIEPSVDDAQYLAVEKVAPFNRRWGDFSLCSWPTDVIDHDDFINNVKTNTVLAEAFAKLNERFLFSPAITLHENNDQSNHIHEDYHHHHHHYSSSTDNGSNERSNEIKEKLSILSSSTPTSTTTPPLPTSTTPPPPPATTTTTTTHLKPIFRSPIAHPDDYIISFSHFLPRIECCPEKRFLIDPALSTVIGSDPLGAQVTRLQPDIHLYGHTHIPMGK